MTTRVLAALALVLVLAGAVYFNAKTRASQSVSMQPRGTSEAAEPVRVVTERVEMSNGGEDIKAVGTVRSDRQAAITARSPGRIVEILVREGSEVSAGQSVAHLDLSDSKSQVAAADAGIEAAQAQVRKALDGKTARKTEMDSQVSQATTGLANAKVKLQQAELGAKLQDSASRSDADRARAAILQAESGLQQAELALEQAEKTLKRVEFLFSKGGAPRVELEGATSQAKIARSQRDGALAALRQAQSAEKPALDAVPLRERVSRQDIEAAQLGVQNAEGALKTARRSRIDALRIADRDVEAARAALRQAQAGRDGAAILIGSSTLTSPLSGTVTRISVHVGEMAQPGMPLMTVVSNDGAYVEASVATRFASTIRPGDRAHIMLDIGSRPIPARVMDVLPIRGEDGRSVPVRIRPLSAAIKLTPGLAVNASIFASESEKRVTIPAEALYADGDSSFVYVIESGRAERRVVQIGSSLGGRVVVLSGLTGTDSVVIRSSAPLRAGLPVISTTPSR